MKPNRYASLLAGTSLLIILVGQGVTPCLADTTNLISNTTYQEAVYDEFGELVAPDGRPRWPWAYRYTWGHPDGFGIDPMQDTYYLEPPDYTNTLNYVLFDTSVYASPPDGAGFGQGFGAGMNWQSFDPETVWPTNLQYYVMSFDARVEGLKPGVNQIGIEMQTQFDSPDDTIQPADSNTDGDRIIQVNKLVQVTSNWTHYAYALDTFSGIGGGSEENLARYAAAMNSANYNVNIHMPSDAFDYDSDNYLLIDNIKLEVIQSTNRPPQPPPLAPMTLSKWNFDDADTAFSYGYGYSPNSIANPVQTQDRHVAGEGVDGSNGWVMTMDNTIYIGMDPLPAWAGVGMGTEGDVNAALMDTTDLASYRVTFTARAEGLAPDVTQTTARLQLLLRAPDDTLQPADSNTEDDTLVRLDFNVPAGTNWTTTSYLLSKGSVGGGSKENLTNYLATATSLKTWRPQFQIENPLSEATWGYDTDNKLVIDDIVLERLMPAAPPLSIARSNDQVTVTWEAPESGTVQLQSASSLDGLWTDVSTIGNSHTVPVTDGSMFFRSVWTPPAE